MAMAVGPSGGSDFEPFMDINTTPLIDVMLVLLITLILNIPAQTHAVKLDMPRPDQQQVQPPVEPEVVAVEIDFDGVFYWNGVQVDRRGLEMRLQQAALKSPQPEVHIRPHRLAEYRYVAAVMASAQRLGLVRIGVIGGAQ